MKDAGIVFPKGLQGFSFVIFTGVKKKKKRTLQLNLSVPIHWPKAFTSDYVSFDGFGNNKYRITGIIIIYLYYLIFRKKRFKNLKIHSIFKLITRDSLWHRYGISEFQRFET